MTPRHEFKSDEDYIEYLRHYYAGQAMNGLLSNSSETETTTRFLFQTLGLPPETKYEFEKHYPAYLAKLADLHSQSLINALNIKQ